MMKIVKLASFTTQPAGLKSALCLGLSGRLCIIIPASLAPDSKLLSWMVIVSEASPAGCLTRCARVRHSVTFKVRVSLT